MFDKIIESCQFLLNNYPEAQDVKAYLDARISSESQDKYQFGYFPNLDHLKALYSLIGDDYLEEIGLVTSKRIENIHYTKIIKRSHFDNHPLIMPYKDPYGKIVGLVGRSILSDSDMKTNKISKYKNTSESHFFKKGHLLFGLYENKKAILDNNLVYVVEGQFDVIKASEKGMKNIVGLGTSNMTAYQFSVISRYTDNIFLLLDNDEAGNKGRKLAVGKFGKLANIQNFYLPESYKDIDEYLTKCNDDSMSFEVRV